MRANRAARSERSRGRGGRKNAGFSLSELLVATLILMLSTSLIVQSLTAAYRHFLAQTQRSEASLLLASLQTAIQEELTYARRPETKTTAAKGGLSVSSPVTFSSYRAGADAGLGKAADGRIYLFGDNLAAPFSLVSSGSYTMESGFSWAGKSYSLAADMTAFTWDGSAFTVTLEIHSAKISGGSVTPGDSLVSSTFLVYPIDA